MITSTRLVFLIGLVSGAVVRIVPAAIDGEHLEAGAKVILLTPTPDSKANLAAGAKLNDLLAPDNHPNRAGHELVTRELFAWFPTPIVGSP